MGPVAPPDAGGGAPVPVTLRPVAPPSLIGGSPFVGPIAPPAAGGAPVMGPVAPQTPVSAPQETVNKDAFTATDDDLKGADTKFHKDSGAKVDDRMKDNQHHNHYHVGVDYGHHHGKRAKHDGKEAAVTPTRQSAQSFANEILDLKRKGDQKAYDMLAMLETSDFDKDRTVLEMVKNADLKDGGIGKRIEGDGF
jgi:hypothetical protein